MAAPACDHPRVRVAAVILLEGRILLVRQAKRDVPYHLLPGGGVDAGESLGDALVREIREETGLTCRPVRPLFVSDTIDPAGGRHLINITFLAERVSGELPAAPPDPTIVSYDHVEPDELETLDLRPPMAEALRTAWESGFEGPARYLGLLWTDG